jgi:hypothetical protein
MPGQSVSGTYFINCVVAKSYWAIQIPYRQHSVVPGDYDSVAIHE